MSSINGASEPVILVEGLRKSFRSRFSRRSVEAVRGVSIEAHEGSVVAFVGPNGAGKTTTIYAMLGLLRPDSGCIRSGTRVLTDTDTGVFVPAYAMTVGGVLPGSQIVAAT